MQKLPSVLLGGQCRSVAGGTGDNGVAYHVKRQDRAVPKMVVMPIRRPIGPLIELSVWRAVVNPELYQRSKDPRVKPLLDRLIKAWHGFEEEAPPCGLNWPQ